MKKGQVPRMLFRLIAVFVLFQWVASVLGSFRGEAGILVGVDRDVGIDPVVGLYFSRVD